MIGRLLALLALVFAAAPIAAATTNATPATLPAIIAAAQPGDTIRLAPGDYGAVAIKKRQWSAPVTFVARADSRLTLRIENSTNVVWKGGAFGPAMGTGPAGYAAAIDRSQNIAISGGTFTQARRGLVIGRSQDVAVASVTMTGLTIDGINIGSSQRVSVRTSYFADFLIGKDHPDFIQMWSRPADGITQDVVIEKNTMIGDAQGITGFNHVRDGVDDGGFDRVAIRQNKVTTSAPQGIALYDCRDCKVSGNTVAGIPGATSQAHVNVFRSTGDFGGNIVTPR